MKNTTENITPICNKHGILIKNVITCGGIGILICLLLIYFSLIGETSFTLLSIVIIASCLFVFYEPRITRAEASAKGFAFDLSEKVDVLQKQTNAMAIKQAEPKERIPTATTGIKVTCEAYGTDDKTQLVIKSIGGTKYTFRNIKGIITDSQLPHDVAKDKLNWLLINELANSFDVDGEKLYALSPKGLRVFAQVVNPTKQKA